MILVLFVLIGLDFRAVASHFVVLCVQDLRAVLKARSGSLKEGIDMFQE